MALGSLKLWAAQAQKDLEEQPPTTSKTIADTALRLLGEVIEKYEGALTEIEKLRVTALKAKLGGPKSDATTASSDSAPRWPRIWADGEAGPSADDVETIQDNSGDTYRWDKSSEKWALLGHDGSPTGSTYHLAWLVEEYGPIIEVGPGVQKIRWFSDDIEGNKEFDLPQVNDEQVTFIQDGEGDKWTRPYRAYNLWSYEGWGHDDRKDDGYDTLFKIIEETGSVTVLRDGPRLSALKFGKDEEEPHETIKQVYNKTTNWFYRNDGNGGWFAPGVDKGMRDKHGAMKIKWAELLENSGNDLHEHIN